MLIAAFAAVYIIWGSTYLAIRFAIETLPPFLMAGVRFLIAGGLLYLWVRWRGTARPERRHWVGATVVGGLLLLGGNGGVVWAEQTVPSGLAALMVATVPLWMVLIDWWRPGGTQPARIVLLGVVIGLVGMVLLVDLEETRSGTVHGLGALVLILASLSWATGSLYSRRANLPRSPFLATAMEMVMGGALLTTAGLATGELGSFDPARVSGRSVAAVIYLIVFGSIIAFTAYIWLLRVVAPAKAGTYAYVNPVVAVALGWALAGEEVTWRTVIAATIIILAVVLITSHRRRPLPDD
ncbi:MAG: drug/metabolite exporter YedA [Acidobacteria bacterium]|nr:MAG: drug/metabolite exporter YedA [Acidobacteriota bacterium]